MKYYIKESVNVSRWDSAAQRLNDTDDIARYFNERLNSIVECISATAAKYRNEKKTHPTPGMLKQLIDKAGFRAGMQEANGRVRCIKCRKYKPGDNFGNKISQIKRKDVCNECYPTAKKAAMKKMRDSLPDKYIISLLTSKKQISTEAIKNAPILIELKRNQLKLLRKTKN